MAIIQGVPGIEVTVRVEGIEVIELSHPEATDVSQRRTDGTKSVNKYIECVGGAHFGVHVAVFQEYAWGHRNHSLNIALFLDGKWAKGEYCREWNTHLGVWEQVMTHRVTRNRSGDFVEQAFQFAKVNKVEDVDTEQHEHDLKRVKRMGSIEVRVYRAIEHAADDEFRPEGPTPVDFGVSAKALKGKTISHGAGYSTPVQTNRPRYVGCTNLQEDNGPIAIFRFLYRSREGLMQEGILRRPSPETLLVETEAPMPISIETPSPTPAPAQKPVPAKTTLEGLSQGQIRALALEKLQEGTPIDPQIKQEQKQKVLIKREFGEIIDLTEPEEPARAYKMSKTANGKDVIELDND
ncbi:hypothetical protein F5B20DRAFT_576883 [Whalleya microplaca]|nr:hypothetical protein F5B20DRAFT_576883 [Whalleya microplaca]